MRCLWGTVKVGCFDVSLLGPLRARPHTLLLTFSRMKSLLSNCPSQDTASDNASTTSRGLRRCFEPVRVINTQYADNTLARARIYLFLSFFICWNVNAMKKSNMAVGFPSGKRSSESPMMCSVNILEDDLKSWVLSDNLQPAFKMLYINIILYIFVYYFVIIFVHMCIYVYGK